MRHYRRSYSGSTRFKKIMFRILFVILAAAVITFSSIFLGHYLTIKVAEAEAALNTSEPASEQITSRPKLPENSSSSRELSAAGLELRNYRTEDAVVTAINTLAEHYDTLLVCLSDADGDLLYTSPALCDMMRITAPEEDAELSLIRSALTAAKSKNLYLCAVMDSSFGILERGQDEQVDGTLYAELASFGVDEILIKNAIIDTENVPADEIAAYLAGCEEITNGACQLGILFPDDVFLNFSNARGIQIIASAADFTGIDMTCYSSVTPDEMYEQMTRDITSLYGSFSIYNMRVVLSTADPDLLAAQAQALRDSDISNVCFTEAIDPATLNYSSRPVPEETPEEEPKEDTAVKVEPQTNPYAYTSEPEDSELTDDPGTEEPVGTDLPQEETPSVGDSWYIDENGNLVRPWY
ncbi:MAG: hypothetical protein IJB20_11540 [Clostridia bacterium]|nr:hypothetical protein [Clostridia bacterium]